VDLVFLDRFSVLASLSFTSVLQLIFMVAVGSNCLHEHNLDSLVRTDEGPSSELLPKALEHIP